MTTGHGARRPGLTWDFARLIAVILNAIVVPVLYAIFFRVPHPKAA